MGVLLIESRLAVYVVSSLLYSPQPPMFCFMYNYMIFKHGLHKGRHLIEPNFLFHSFSFSSLPFFIRFCR